jgi:uncharacterized membrane protein
MPSAGPLELVLTLVTVAIYMTPVVILIALIRRRRAPVADPLDVLRVRLARGEIDESEFLRLRAVLRSR